MQDVVVGRLNYLLGWTLFTEYLQWGECIKDGRPALLINIPGGSGIIQGLSGIIAIATIPPKGPPTGGSMIRS